MTNYTTIVDKYELEKFIAWLPELTPDETLYYSLIARNKYVSDAGIGTMNSDKHQCARFVVQPERLALKLAQTEAPVGSYGVKNIIVPQQALASYITINPRSYTKAAKRLLKRLVDVVADNEPSPNIYQESLTALHRALSRKIFVDIDFDCFDSTPLIRELSRIINKDAVDILFTRGGFHAIIRLDAVEQKYVKTWYKNIQSLPNVDIMGDNQIPVPGTYQGGFVPYMRPLSKL